MRRLARAAVQGVLVAGALWLAPSRARADAQACVAASDDGQARRDEGKLRAAREDLLKCAAPSCPSVVRTECAKWLADVEARLPSVVFGVRDAAGNDVSAVRIVMDGAPLADRADGRSVPVDPGEHRFRFEADAGSAEMRAVVREGEKGRVLQVTLIAPRTTTPPETKPAPPAPAPPPPSDKEPARPSGRVLPVGAVVAAGVSVVGFAGFTYFWLSAVGSAKDLRDACTPECAHANVTPIKTKAALADVSLGVGVVGALVAAGFVLLTPRVDVAPVRGGALVTTGGRF